MTLKLTALAAVTTAAIACGAGLPAAAAPVTSGVAGLKDAAPAHLIDVQYRGHGGPRGGFRAPARGVYRGMPRGGWHGAYRGPYRGPYYRGPYRWPRYGYYPGGWYYGPGWYNGGDVAAGVAAGLIVGGLAAAAGAPYYNDYYDAPPPAAYAPGRCWVVTDSARGLGYWGSCAARGAVPYR